MPMSFWKGYIMTPRLMRSTTASIALIAACWPGYLFGQPVELLDFTTLSEACQATIIADGTIDPLTLTTAMVEIAEDGTCVVLDPAAMETEIVPRLAPETDPALEAEVVPEAEAVEAVEPESVVEPEAVVEPDAVVEPEAAVEPEVVVEPELAVEPEPVVEPVAEPEPIVEEVVPEEAVVEDVAPVEAEPVAEETMTEETVIDAPVLDEAVADEPAMEAGEPVIDESGTEAANAEEFSFLTLSEECQATIIADGRLDIATLVPEQLVIADDGSCEIVVAATDEPVVEPEIVVEAAPPAAAAEVRDDPAEESADAVDVVTETVTDETTRSSDEEVAAAAADLQRVNNNNDARDLAKILGAVGVGIVIGTLLDNNDTVVGDTGDRVIVERDGRYIVRNDENELLRRPGSDIRTEEFTDGSTRTIVTREDGIRIVTIRDSQGYVVRRTRFLADGTEFVLFDDSAYQSEVITSRDLPRVTDEPVFEDYSTIDEDELLRALQAAELRDQNRTYSLRQIRENEVLRAALPRVDLDVITFATGSAAISQSQAQSLAGLGRVMARMIDDNPAEVFLIEGHTDAVGSEISNLALSDRRAESVALALSEYFGVPPENMIVQGYGEEFLKVQTLGAERANRRTAVRRITNLLGT